MSSSMSSRGRRGRQRARLPGRTQLGRVGDRGDPRTPELRDFVKGLTERAGVRAPRLGYRDEAVACTTF